MKSLKRFFIAATQKIYGVMTDATRNSNDLIIPYAMLGIFTCIPFYFLNLHFSPQAYENLPLRLVSTLLCFPLAFKNYWPKKWQKSLPFYWYATQLYMMPFFFTFMTLKNHMSSTWQLNMVQLVLFLVLLVDWISFIVLIFIGFFIGYLAYYLSTAPPIIPIYHGGFLGFAFSIFIFALFARGKQKIEDEKLDVMKSLAATIAHELRTPLRTINSSSSGIKDFLPKLIQGYQLAKEQQLPVPYISPLHFEALLSACEHIESETESAFTMINMLLVNVNQSRINRQDFKVCSAQQCLTKAIHNYPFDGDEAKLIHWNDDQDFLFLGNPLLFTHIVFNLLKNSLYYVKAAHKGEIYIWLEKARDYHVIHFKDTGQGISADTLPHIFERFFTRTLHGAGIGLAFCKMVMESFDGKITCESKSGEYTEFRLYFPNDPALQR